MIRTDAYDGRDEYPVFVTAGDGKDKLSHIMHNRYLAHCYEVFFLYLRLFGRVRFQFWTVRRQYLIEAINQAVHHDHKAGEKLFNIYIDVYSQADVEHIESIKKKFRCKVRVFDSKSVNVWGK